jgi:hypothetical protein
MMRAREAFVVGIAAGAASAVYLIFHYQPILLNGTIHAAIFGSGLAAIHYFKRSVNLKNAGAYIAGALPVHLAIHIIFIRDIVLPFSFFFFFFFSHR